jgi:hypothetical protein
MCNSSSNLKVGKTLIVEAIAEHYRKLIYLI